MTTVIKRRVPSNETPDQRTAVINLKKINANLRLKSLGWKALGLLKDLVIFGLLLFIVSKPTPVVVTRGTGEREALSFMTGTERSPELVKAFVISAMTDIHSWKNALPDKGMAPDPGISLKSGKIIPTAVFRNSLYLESKFANSYREVLGELVSTSQLSNPSVQVACQILATDSLVKLSDGKYQIRVIGNLIKFTPGIGADKIPFNKLVTMQAIPPMLPSEIAKRYPNPDPKNISQIDLFRNLESMTAKGLQITNITTATK